MCFQGDKRYTISYNLKDRLVVKKIWGMLRNSFVPLRHSDYIVPKEISKDLGVKFTTRT